MRLNPCALWLCITTFYAVYPAVGALEELSYQLDALAKSPKSALTPFLPRQPITTKGPPRKPPTPKERLENIISTWQADSTSNVWHKPVELMNELAFSFDDLRKWLREKLGKKDIYERPRVESLYNALSELLRDIFDPLQDNYRKPISPDVVVENTRKSIELCEKSLQSHMQYQLQPNDDISATLNTWKKDPLRIFEDDELSQFFALVFETYQSFICIKYRIKC